MNRLSSANVAMFCFLVTLGVIGRLFSFHLMTWNFTPVIGVTLFAGFYFGSVALAMGVPLAIMLITNLVIGPYESWQMAVAVYACLLLPIAMRGLLRPQPTALRVTGTALASSVSFFVLSNLAHWWFHARHDGVDLVTNFVNAVPFYRTQLPGDLCWAALLFGGYALAQRFGYVQPAPAPVAARSAQHEAN